MDELTSAMRPAVPDIAMVPCASMRGRAGAAVLAPEASATTYVALGAMVPVRAVRCQEVPAAEAYCTDQPSSETGWSEEL